MGIYADGFDIYFNPYLNILKLFFNNKFDNFLELFNL